MGVTFILVISILIQFAAAFLALRLIWITGRRVAWVLIATALFFMAIRRCITLFQAEFLGVPYTTSISAELVALVISILMLNGVIWVESKRGKGSTFLFTLPYRKSMDVHTTSHETTG